MSSPGQRRGSCGHVMALFDMHTKCARCREKGIGGDDCVLKKPCSICEKFTEDQKAQLATPKYRVRKESGQKKSDSPAHVAASDVTVLGKVERKGEGSSDRGETPPKKVKKTSHKSPLKKKSNKPSDLQTLDDKWSERFSRLEALFLSKSFTVPVEPVKNSDVPVTDRPFIPPTAASTSSQQQKSTGQMKGQKATQPVEAPGALPGSQLMDQVVSATQPVEAPGTDTESLPADQQLTLSTTTGVRSQLHSPVPAMKPSVASTGPTVTVEEPEEEVPSDRSSHSPDEGELSDRESVQEQEDFIEGDQELSAEQSYRETLRGVRSFMAWNDIPEFDSASSSQDDNPFTGNRTSQTGKVSVKVPVDEWLCHKFEKLNLTLQEGYPTRNSETAGLSKDQFIKPPRTLKWYGMHSEKKDFSRSKVYTWTSEPARLNSSFPRIAGRSLPSAPASRPVSQDTLRKWERAARDQTYMCNQAAAFSRCLTKVQENMANQLKIIQGITSKGKSSSKLTQASDELDFLVTFNRSITQAMARTMQDLSDGVFVNVANLTLARRDSYLDFIRSGIKQDTLMSLRSAPLHMSALFPDHIITKAEEEIRHFEDKRTPGPTRKGQRFHPYAQSSKPHYHQQSEQTSTLPAWKQLRRRGHRSTRGKASSFSQRPAKSQKPFK